MTNKTFFITSSKELQYSSPTVRVPYLIRLEAQELDVDEHAVVRSREVLPETLPLVAQLRRNDEPSPLADFHPHDAPDRFVLHLVLDPGLVVVRPSRRGGGRERVPVAQEVCGVRDFGSFHTKHCRGGVERRQLELKGVEDGD
eukprot:31250-Pelagococcus_subviridis.AAC.4